MTHRGRPSSTLRQCAPRPSGWPPPRPLPGARNATLSTTGRTPCVLETGSPPTSPKLHVPANRVCVCALCTRLYTPLCTRLHGGGIALHLGLGLSGDSLGRLDVGRRGHTVAQLLGCVRIHLFDLVDQGVHFCSGQEDTAAVSPGLTPLDPCGRGPYVLPPR